MRPPAQHASIHWQMWTWRWATRETRYHRWSVLKGGNNQQAHMRKHWQGRTVAHRAGTVVFVRCGAFSWDLAERREHLRGYWKLVKPEKLQSIFRTIQSCQAGGSHGASEQKKTRVLVLYVIKKHITSANLQQEHVFKPEFRTQCIYILTYDKPSARLCFTRGGGLRPPQGFTHLGKSIQWYNSPM